MTVLEHPLSHKSATLVATYVKTSKKTKCRERVRAEQELTVADFEHDSSSKAGVKKSCLKSDKDMVVTVLQVVSAFAVLPLTFLFVNSFGPGRDLSPREFLVNSVHRPLSSVCVSLCLSGPFCLRPEAHLVPALGFNPKVGA